MERQSSTKKSSFKAPRFDGRKSFEVKHLVNLGTVEMGGGEEPAAVEAFRMIDQYIGTNGEDGQFEFTMPLSKVGDASITYRIEAKYSA
jgi:hypothetical protein